MVLQSIKTGLGFAAGPGGLKTRSVSSLLNDFLLEMSWLGVTKSDFVGGESVVAVGNGIHLLLHDLSVERVEEDLLVSSAVNGHSRGSAGDVGGEHLKRC